MSGLNPFRKVQLINNFGITDEAVISEAESMFTNLAALQGMPDGNSSRQRRGEVGCAGGPRIPGG